jgi:hypothetical protein
MNSSVSSTASSSAPSGTPSGVPSGTPSGTPSSASSSAASSSAAYAPIVHRRDCTDKSDLWEDVAGGVADFKINNTRMTARNLSKISKSSERKSKGYKPKNKSHRIIKEEKK